jgi:hypothetical protein
LKAKTNAAAISFGAGSAVSNSAAAEILVNQGGATSPTTAQLTVTVGGAVKVVARTGGTVDFQGNITSNQPIPTMPLTPPSSLAANTAGEPNTGRYGALQRHEQVAQISSTATAVSAVNNNNARSNSPTAAWTLSPPAARVSLPTNKGTINVSGASNDIDTDTGSVLVLNDRNDWQR